MKKEVLIIVICLIILVIIIPIMLSEEEEEEKFEKMPLKKQITKSLESPRTLPIKDAPVDEPIDLNPQVGPIASVKIVSGVVSNDENGFSASQIEDLTTRDGVGIGPAEGVEVDKDGSVRAVFNNILNVRNQYGGEGMSNFFFDNGDKTFSMSSGKNLLFKKPYAIYFFEVGESWFRVDENDNLLAWRVQFPSRAEYLIENPLSRGLVPSQNTVPKVIYYDTAQNSLFGSAVGIVTNKESMAVDNAFIARGDYGQFFSGNNSNFSGNQPGSELNFWLTGRSSMQLGSTFSKEGVLQVNTSEGFAGMHYRFRLSDESSYFGTALNATVLFDGRDFREKLDGSVVQFQLDVFEGYYGHNFFSSPGFYSFEFLDKPEFHSVSPNNPLVQADKSRAQNFRFSKGLNSF